MIEIKFRVWDGVDFMSKPFTLRDLQERKIQFTNDCAVMQFTRLKDKNDKDVYDGDIVKAAWMHHGKPGQEFTAFILYNEHIGSFRIGYESLDGWSQDEIYFSYQIEVVGNVFENPELLPNLPDIGQNKKVKGSITDERK